jgi:hypothetical protein
MRRALENWPAIVVLALAPAGCGYRVSGHADLLPKSIRSIAIPAFGNVTTRYKLADRVTQAVTQEFINRTRYQIVADANQADAILQGAVLSYSAYPTVFDPLSGRATGVQTIVLFQVSLVERATGATLFTRPNLELRERYEISVDPKEYFDESGVAMQRLSEDAARTIVSAILENF